MTMHTTTTDVISPALLGLTNRADVIRSAKRDTAAATSSSGAGNARQVRQPMNTTHSASPDAGISGVVVDNNASHLYDNKHNSNGIDSALHNLLFAAAAKPTKTRANKQKSSAAADKTRATLRSTCDVDELTLGSRENRRVKSTSGSNAPGHQSQTTDNSCASPSAGGSDKQASQLAEYDWLR